MQLALQTVPQCSGLAKSVIFKLLPQHTSGRGEDLVPSEGALSPRRHLLQAFRLMFDLNKGGDLPGSTSKVPYGYIFGMWQKDVRFPRQQF